MVKIFGSSTPSMIIVEINRRSLDSEGRHLISQGPIRRCFNVSSVNSGPSQTGFHVSE